MVDMPNARRVMVDNQIRTFDVTDRAVIAAFETVPREAFVGPENTAIAYADRTIVTGTGATRRAMLPPLILARLIQALQPQAGERALDVMSGSGYPAAILAEIGLETVVLEADAALAEAAARALQTADSTATVAAPQPDLNPTNVAALPGDGFDVILVNGATEREPRAFFPLLRNGGRLGIIQRQGVAARVLVYVKSGDTVSPRRAFDAQAPVLPGFAAEPGFVF